MSEKILAPDIRRVLDSLGRRVGILERRVNPSAVAAGGGSNDEIIFSYPGALSVNESPPVKLRYDGFLASVAIALTTAGSSTTTIQIKRNGTVIATLTVGSGVADSVPAVNVRVFGEDRLSVRISGVGTGAAGLTVMARFT